MPRPVREDIRQQTIAEIKQTARQQMREKGTAGLSLRAIAREMGITAPAIYNYFPKMDDLITALIVDAFNAHADAIEEAMADAKQNSASIYQQLMAGFQMYRRWAVQNPTQFLLIYGNPIPGYEAPIDITRPLAIRPANAFFGRMQEALQQGIMQIPDDFDQSDLSDAMQTRLTHWKAFLGTTMPECFLLYGLLCWTRIHGIIMLELLHHLQPDIVDVDNLYTLEIQNFLRILAEK